MAYAKEALKEDLKRKLKEILRFEGMDLDFGIYRIMNYKSGEIERFIEEGLIREIEDELSLGLERYSSELGKVYYGDRLIGGRGEGGKEQVLEGLEKYIYTHLINFFSRYYEGGDFISKRRYSKREKYVIPYNGEEVLLYWVNRDQYYVKTTRYFGRYTFWNGDKSLRVTFRVIRAEEEKGDVKSQEKRFFILSKKAFDFDEEEGRLDLYFEYRALSKEEKRRWGSHRVQERLNDEVVELLKGIKSGLLDSILREEGRRSLLKKHLYIYTKKNTSDYFICKDLKSFLERELDFYIKNELLHLDDVLESDIKGLKVHFLGVKVFKSVALKIVDLLAQIENFQKKLWEKKKFVISTNYVITLDKIVEYVGEGFLRSILDEILENAKQVEEWKRLFGVEVRKEEDLIEDVGSLGKDKWKRLPVDTKYFNEGFKWRLLSGLSESRDLDEILDGVLVKSENWQALNLLMEKYRGKVKAIYADPPYNTGSDGFLYKDNYQSSSWLTFVYNRLELSLDFLRKDGVFFVSIANNANYYKESYKLALLLDTLLSKRFADLIWKRRSGSGSYVISDITEIHEYILCWGNEEANILKNILGFDKLKKYKCKDEKGIFKWHDLVIHQYTKEQRPNLFYGVVYDFVEDKINFDKDPKDVNPLKEVVIYPSEDGKSVFTMTKQSMREVYERGVIGVIKERGKYKVKVKKYLQDERGIVVGDPLKSILSENKWIHKIGGTDEATREIKALFKHIKFDTAKPTSLIELLMYVATFKDSVVLDFFAGSGVTAHALMKLNKEDGGCRKFVLVEMADHFDTIIIPRIKKIAYSFNWKNGKPQDNEGIGVFFKYHTLEQYEDALENIEFKDKQEALYQLKDYLVRYMLEWETKHSRTFLNVGVLKDPFNYKLKVMERYMQRVVNVDLVETFNYLLGLHVKEYRIVEDDGRRYIFVLGDKAGKKVAVVWRSVVNIDFEKDKLLIKNVLDKFSPDKVYVNGDSVLGGFTPVELDFKFLMFRR